MCCCMENRLDVVGVQVRDNRVWSGALALEQGVSSAGWGLGQIKGPRMPGSQQPPLPLLYTPVQP